MEHRAEPCRQLDQPERCVRLEGAVEDAEDDDGEADGKGGRPEARDLTDGREETVGVGDDEPPCAESEDRTEDPGHPARPQVHYGSIVGHA